MQVQQALQAFLQNNQRLAPGPASRLLMEGQNCRRQSRTATPSLLLDAS
jgi:hypothetical protein